MMQTALLTVLALAGLPDRIVVPPSDTAVGPFTFVGPLDTAAVGNSLSLINQASLTMLDPGWAEAFGAAVNNPEVYGVFDRIKVEVAEGAITPTQAAQLFGSLYLYHKTGNRVVAYSLACCAGTATPAAATDTTTAGGNQLRRSKVALVMKLPHPIAVDFQSDTLSIRVATAVGVGTLPVYVTLWGAAAKQAAAGRNVPRISSADFGETLKELSTARGFANIGRLGRNAVSDGILKRFLGGR